MYYSLNNNKTLFKSLYRGADQQNLDITQFKNLDIPIPSQETQTQVVQTLDDLANLRQNYMDIRDGLERRMKYYFEMMMASSGCEWKKLGDVCEIEQGTSLPKKNMVNNGDYKVIGGGKVIGTHNINNRNGAETTITRVGELTVTFINEKFYGLFRSILNTKERKSYVIQQEVDSLPLIGSIKK